MTAAAKRFYYCYNRLKNKISAAGNISCLHYYRLEAISNYFVDSCAYGKSRGTYVYYIPAHQIMRFNI